MTLDIAQLVEHREALIRGSHLLPLIQERGAAQGELDRREQLRHGDPVLGLHLYSWAFITFAVVIIFAAVLGIMAPAALPQAPKQGSLAYRVSTAVGLVFLAVIAINVAMIVFLEGFNWVLPDDPTSYDLFRL